MQAYRAIEQGLKQIRQKSTECRWNPSNPQPLLPRRITLREEKDIKFIDKCRVRVRAGKGGNGLCCFSGRFLRPFAGPDGGNGGNGGDVIFRASKGLTSLESVDANYVARSGNPGESSCRTGKRGRDVVIDIPSRVRIRLVEGVGPVVTDLLVPKQTFTAAYGGIGGRGNFAFLSNTDRAPDVWEEGLPAEEKVYDIEMLQIAHFALVGMPNAGKSSFLRAVSRAKPRVAEFPFTTLFPQIGAVDFEDNTRISIAEIPGLVTGAAAKNVGNGLMFLKHMRACTCLVILINLQEDEPWNQFEVLKEEIEQFDEKLFDDKPIIVVGNKIETEGAHRKWGEFKKHIEADNRLASTICIPISVKERINLAKLLNVMRRVLIRYERIIEAQMAEALNC